jgi:hypothetical protein
VGETQPPSDWPSDWPGLEAERDGVTYDAQKIASIAQALREVMEPISGGGSGDNLGSLQDLSSNGSLHYDVCSHLRSLENWEGGKSFAATLEQSHQTFVDVLEEVLENFTTAISLVEAEASTYQATNAANEGTV